MHDPLTGYIRVKAVCVFGHMGRVLAIDGFDPTKQERFWVPVGGRVEFGESSEQAVIREVHEELDAEVTDVRLLGVLENLFTFDGDDGHEIVFVYDGRFVDDTLYETDLLIGIEAEATLTAYWVDPLLPDHGRPLYPDGLADLLRGPTDPRDHPA